MLNMTSAAGYVLDHFAKFNHPVNIETILEEQPDMGDGEHTVTVWFTAFDLENSEPYSGNFVVWVERYSDGSRRLYGEW